jgi:hypothetical protein
MRNDSIRVASAATLVETSLVVLARQGEPGLVELRAFIDIAGIEIAPSMMSRRSRRSMLFAGSERVGTRRVSI